ncbi:hypothetical protein DVT68_17585 [Dyella solisilvae]|uniref:Uncharacterized protein n=1 Tax=Dyella solisilvae TaxID=1920168 RepID=A0A370K3D2_9GAMM|nr:hypothetical protein DVT68_17585 [Dyella solisilvae]
MPPPVGAVVGWAGAVLAGAGVVAAGAGAAVAGVAGAAGAGAVAAGAAGAEVDSCSFLPHALSISRPARVAQVRAVWRA